MRGPENGHFSLFLDQFQTRLSLHISGLEGLEMDTFLVWGASRPCSAECCLVLRQPLMVIERLGRGGERNVTLHSFAFNDSIHDLSSSIDRKFAEV